MAAFLLVAASLQAVAAGWLPFSLTVAGSALDLRLVGTRAMSSGSGEVLASCPATRRRRRTGPMLQSSALAPATAQLAMGSALSARGPKIAELAISNLAPAEPSACCVKLDRKTTRAVSQMQRRSLG